MDTHKHKLAKNREPPLHNHNYSHVESVHTESSPNEESAVGWQDLGEYHSAPGGASATILGPGPRGNVRVARKSPERLCAGW